MKRLGLILLLLFAMGFTYAETILSSESQTIVKQRVQERVRNLEAKGVSITKEILTEIEKQETAEMEWQLSQSKPPVPANVSELVQQSPPSKVSTTIQPSNNPPISTSQLQTLPNTDYDLPEISPTEVNELVNTYTEPESVEPSYTPQPTTYEPVSYETSLPSTKSYYAPQQSSVDYSPLGWLVLIGAICGVFIYVKRRYKSKKAILITGGLMFILLIMANFETVISFLDELPATKIFFLVATVVLVMFSIPLWKKLNKST